MKRLELSRIRLCNRCGRGAAELRTDDGDSLVVPLDPVRARQLSEHDRSEELRSLTDFLIERLESHDVSEVVLDIDGDRLRALLSLVHEDDPEVLACTAEEGVALAVRGKLRLYATDEALAQGAAAKAARHGGPDTVH